MDQPSPLQQATAALTEFLQAPPSTSPVVRDILDLVADPHPNRDFHLTAGLLGVSRHLLQALASERGTTPEATLQWYAYWLAQQQETAEK